MKYVKKEVWNYGQFLLYFCPIFIVLLDSAARCWDYALVFFGIVCFGKYLLA
jgi:hypothetical protein